VRRRLILGLVPMLLAGMATLASPLPALASGEVLENGTTSYVVNTARSEIDVTVQLSIRNNKPPTHSVAPCPGGYYTCTWTTNYYWDWIEIAVETQAGPLKATSNGGKVRPSTAHRGTYYNLVRLNYPAVYYHQTRTINVTYAIPAGPDAAGGFRAGKAYVDLCAVGNGYDSGSVQVVLPSGYNVAPYAGWGLGHVTETGSQQTLSSGTISQPNTFWTCFEGTNPANLTRSTVSTPDQTFTIEAWPEDAGWAATVGADVQAEASKLEDLTGLKMPGGTIQVQEAGASQLGEYVGSYNSSTKTATVAEDTDHATVAHELSHIWFNRQLFLFTWMNEGFAGYSEKAAGVGNYKPCTYPGAYPGAGPADLTVWRFLDRDSTKEDQSVTDWQYAASCYLVTNLADTMGPASFKAVLVAASNGEIAYLGADPAEKSPNGGSPVSAQMLLDLVDERGMLPAGVEDLDRVQNLLDDYVMFSKTQLDARSKARSNYHQLLDATGGWKLPLAIRSPMASWEFATAQSAMDTATQILALRAEVQKNVSGLSLDGTPIQTQFEAVKTQADLDALLALTKKEADAAARLAQAKQLNDGSHSIFQTVGLLGADPGASIAAATDAIKNAKPDDASAAAQKAIDLINGSGDQGLIRLGILLATILVVVGILGFLLLYRRRRGRALAIAAAADAPLAVTADAPPTGVDSAIVWANEPPVADVPPPEVDTVSPPEVDTVSPPDPTG
jgi:hypothetical protein